MTVTKPQLQALHLLARRECYTAIATYGDCNVSGAVAKTLVQQGLAIYSSGWPVGKPGFTKVQITIAGRTAIEGTEEP